MTKPIPLLVALLLATAGLPRTVEAQLSDNMAVTIDGETVETPNQIIYLNAKQCGKKDADADAAIHVELSQLPASTFLEVWTDRGANNDCNTAAARSPTSASAEPACRQIDDAVIMNPVSVGAQKVELKARTLFAKGDDECASGLQKIYFVSLNSRTANTATGNAEGIVPTGKKPYTLALTVDVVIPTAVPSIKPSDGESQVGASWGAATETKFLEYRLYFDPSGIAKRGEPCESEELVAGEVIANESDLEWTNDKGTSASKNPKSLGMSLGEQIPVAVAVRDLAENESTVSEVVCASYIDTKGFYDSYTEMDGNGLTTCAADPWKSNGSGTLAAFFLIALGFVARRRLS